MVCWSLALALFVEYPSRRIPGILRELEIVVTTNLVAVLMFTLSVFLLKVLSISRVFVCVYLGTVIVLMLVNRYVVRLMLYVLRNSGWDTHSRILVGATQSTRRYLSEIAADRRLGVHVVGYVSQTDDLHGVPYLGTYRDIDQILKDYTPDGVVVGLRVTEQQTENIIRSCEKQGVSVELILDGLAFRIASSSVHHGNMVSSLYLSAIPHTPGSLLFKRVTDILISVCACTLLLPVFLLVATAIKMEDGGPVLFKQERVGLRGKKFWIYKFRSMCVDAEQKRLELIDKNEMSGPVFKLTDDPRVTKVGRFIRSFSIDELPQLFNVIIGSMSLVGPRPPLPTEVSQYVDEHRRRLSVKPGLTCLWQVSGRNNVDFDKWMDLDLNYIDNWSYLQDWKIMFQTIPAVLKRTGAR